MGERGDRRRSYDGRPERQGRMDDRPNSHGHQNRNSNGAGRMDDRPGRMDERPPSGDRRERSRVVLSPEALASVRIPAKRTVHVYAPSPPTVIDEPIRDRFECSVIGIDYDGNVQLM